MANVLNASKRALRGRSREKVSGPVSSWRDHYGKARPRVAALVGLATGGSHYVLHKIHGHPAIISLEQGELYPKLKFYFGRGTFPIQKIASTQLLPSKKSLRDIEWIVLNKPQMAFVAKQYLFHRDEIRAIFCFRNPMALFYSRQLSKSKLGQELYGAAPSWESLAEWISQEYLVSLASFAQVYDPQRDGVVNLESFASRLDENLAALFQLLDVPLMPAEELSELEYCEDDGQKLQRSRKKIKSREEEALHCPSCGRVYTGPGGYNYIRNVSPAKLAGWQEKEHAEELLAHFSNTFGSEMMNYFGEEDYMKKYSHIEFRKLFDQLMISLQRKAR